MSTMAVEPSGERGLSRWLPLFVVVAISAGLWAVLFVAIPFRDQDFPLNDDWSYGRGVFRFIGGEGIHYSGWAAMPQLGQWLWAWPFVLAFGKSFAALRLSTIILSWLGLAAFYDLLLGIAYSGRQAGFAAAVLALNPLFFLLQGTFMTDVPALSFSLLTLAFYDRVLRRGQWAWLPVAATLGVLGAVTRQNTLLAPLAVSVLLLRVPGWGKRLLGVLAITVPVAVGLTVHFWMQQRPDASPTKPGLPDDRVIALLPFLVLHLMGLTVLPMLALVPRPRAWKWFALPLALMAIMAFDWREGGDFLPYGGLFPYCDNMITPWGAFAGSRVIQELVPGVRPLLLGTAARVALTVLGCLGGAVWLARGAQRLQTDWLPSPLLLFTYMQIPLILFSVVYFDRYFIFMMPGAIYLAGIAIPAAVRFRWAAGLAVLALFGAASMGLMHDWLAWNSARWTVGRRAVERGIDPMDIEGGFEWDGWYAPHPRLFFQKGQPRDTANLLLFTQNAFDHVRGIYQLSFSERPGMTTVEGVPYTLWLTPGYRYFYLLKAGPPAPDTGHNPRRPRAQG